MTPCSLSSMCHKPTPIDIYYLCFPRDSALQKSAGMHFIRDFNLSTSLTFRSLCNLCLRMGPECAHRRKFLRVNSGRDIGPHTALSLNRRWMVQHILHECSHVCCRAIILCVASPQTDWVTLSDWLDHTCERRHYRFARCMGPHAIL